MFGEGVFFVCNSLFGTDLCVLSFFCGRVSDLCNYFGRRSEVLSFVLFSFVFVLRVVL